MRLEFWGTPEEFNQFKKKYPNLADCVDYMEEGSQHDKKYAETEAQIKKDIEDMKYLKEKFVDIMDKAIKRMPEEKEDQER